MNESKRNETKKNRKRTIAIPHQSHLIEFDVKWYKYNTPVGQSCSQNKVNIHSIYTGTHSHTQSAFANKQTHTHIPTWRLYWQAEIHTRSRRWNIEFEQLAAAWLPAASFVQAVYTTYSHAHCRHIHTQCVYTIESNRIHVDVECCCCCCGVRQ